MKNKIEKIWKEIWETVKKNRKTSGIVLLAVIVGIIVLCLILPQNSYECVYKGKGRDKTDRDRLVIGSSGIVSANDLWLKDDDIASVIRAAVYTPLVSIDGESNVSLKLAKDIQYKDDGKKAEIQLKNASFSDGTALTPDLVKESYERYIYEKCKQDGLGEYGVIEGADAYTSGETDDISGIRCTGDSTVEIEFNRISYNNLKVLTAPIIKEGEHSTIIGCGEYRISEQIPNQSIIFEKNDYCESDEYEYDEVELVYLTQKIQEERMKDQKLDVMYVDWENEAEELKSAGYMNVYELRKTPYSFIGFDEESEWYQEERKKERQNVFEMIPGKKLKEKYYGDQGVFRQNIIPGTAGDHTSFFDRLLNIGKQYTLVMGTEDDAFSQSFYSVLENTLQGSGLKIEQTDLVDEAGNKGKYDIYFEGRETGEAVSSYLENYLSKNEQANKNYTECMAESLTGNPLDTPGKMEEFLEEEAIIYPIRSGVQYVAVSKSKKNSELLSTLFGD